MGHVRGERANTLPGSMYASAGATSGSQHARRRRRTFVSKGKGPGTLVFLLLLVGAIAAAGVFTVVLQSWNAAAKGAQQPDAKPGLHASDIGLPDTSASASSTPSKGASDADDAMKRDAELIARYCTMTGDGGRTSPIVFEHLNMDATMVIGWPDDALDILEERAKRTNPQMSSRAELEKVSDFTQCCHACALKRGCNFFFFCGQDDAPCSGECWLKYTAYPDKDVHKHEKTIAGSVEGTDVRVPWTTGVIPGRSPGVRQKDGLQNERLAEKLVLKLRGGLGEIVIRLRPELSKESVEYISSIVGIANDAKVDEDPCLQCRLYRTETNFLIQGVLRRLPLLDGDGVVGSLETGVPSGPGIKGKGMNR